METTHKKHSSHIDSITNFIFSAVMLRCDGCNKWILDHYRWHTIEGLRFMGNMFERQIVRWSFLNLLGGLGWWMNRFVPHESLKESSLKPLIRSFGKFLLPIAKFIQLLTPKSFAQSLYVVLKKGSS